MVSACRRVLNLGAMSSPRAHGHSPKRRRTSDGTGVAVGVGPEELRAWPRRTSTMSNFAPEMRELLLSSPNIRGVHVLRFVLEGVLRWGDGANLSRHDGIKALEFVTQWLGRDHSGKVTTPSSSSVPSLATLSAQRVAMEIFPALVKDLDRHYWRKNLAYFTDEFEDKISSTLSDRGVGENWHETVSEEMIVFTIVYFLFVDVRTMKGEPSHAGELRLPVENDNDECWWINSGQHEVLASVPNYGRGSLAKVGILCHAIYSNYRERSPTECEWGILHLDMIELLFRTNEKRLCVQHPLAYTAACVPIAAIVESYVRSHSHDFLIDHRGIEDTLIPWIRQAGVSHTIYPSHGHFLLETAKRMTTPMQLPHVLPFSFTEVREVVQRCHDLFDAFDRFEEIATGDFGVRVRRMKLAGDYSKEEIIYAAVVSSWAEIVDLHKCWNLDEECLGAVLHYMSGVRVMLLNETHEESDVIRRVNAGREVKIDFLFAGACK